MSKLYAVKLLLVY